jgi:hypothetical protein
VVGDKALLECESTVASRDRGECRPSPTAATDEMEEHLRGLGYIAFSRAGATRKLGIAREVDVIGGQL